MWDGFPGLARLIFEHRAVIAANPGAEKLCYGVGACCAKVGDPKIHRAYKLERCFKEGEAVAGHEIGDRIRCRTPVVGRPDACAHLAD